MLTSVLAGSGCSTVAEASNRELVEAAKSLDAQNKTVRILYPEGCKNNIEPVTALFSEATGAGFEYVETSVDDINTVILNQAARQDSNFDVALPATFGIPDLVEAGALADITPFAELHEPRFQYSPSIYDLGDSYKSRKYGYQTDGDIYLMFYNADMLQDEEKAKAYADRFGVELAVPATWDELDRQMMFFHSPEIDEYGGCMFRISDYMAWEWWIRMHAKGGRPFRDDMAADIASDAGVSALEKLIAATEYQHPSVRSNGLFANWQEYAKGHSYANIGWGGTQKYMNGPQSSVKGRLFHAPTPEVSYFNWGWNYVVSNFSPEKELAYLFCLFATMPEASINSVRENGFFDPYRKEHYQDEVIKSVYGEPFLEAHEKGMSSAIPDLYISRRNDYFAALKANITAALIGDITASQALQLTALQWDGFTEEIGLESQLQQWNFLKQQYPG